MIVLPRFPEPVDHYRTLVLVLAAAGLVYGSLLAFRMPDVRGIVAYSSLGQMSLIVLGLFSATSSGDLGAGGAILQSVAHGLVSAALFLLAGMVERRTGTGELASLGGMAKGRPALATLIMVAGIFTLAVPGSANFAGEFLILAGVYNQGWGYAVAGAAAIVFAAMYALRLISGILHERRGPAVPEGARDLRPLELSIVVPLVALLLALSAWPAAVSDHSFPPVPGAEAAP
jgi:NADH-quinone oxidoreductase subunit M